MYFYKCGMWWLGFTVAYCLYWGELMSPFRRNTTLLICCIKERLCHCPGGDVKEYIEYIQYIGRGKVKLKKIC